MELQNVGLEYSVRHGIFHTFRHAALKDVTFSIQQGETLGILGRNGSGKSTLLQILTGLLAPTSGSLLLPNGDVTRALLSLGLGFRNDLSGRDNVLLGLALQGYSRGSAKGLLPEIEEFAEVGDFFHEPVRTYSAGMRARLGFATGVCSNVDVLLIDEVLSVGDVEFRAKAEKVMHERMGGSQTVVFVTQAHQQVSRLCNRAIWIDKGEIQEIGDAKAVSEQYRDAMTQKA